MVKGFSKAVLEQTALGNVAVREPTYTSKDATEVHGCNSFSSSEESRRSILCEQG